MTDDVFLTGEPEPETPATESARPFKPGFLPDGTKLLLTAGVLLDLAELNYEDFTDYVPKSPVEFAQLLYMAANAPKEGGPGPWHDARGDQRPLINDIRAFRAEVTRWVSEMFRPSEFGHVFHLGVDLWVSANKTRATPSSAGQKKTEAPPLITLTSSSNASTTSPEGTSSPETTPST